MDEIAGRVAIIGRALTDLKGDNNFGPNQNIRAETGLWEFESTAGALHLDSLDVLELILILEDEYDLMFSDIDDFDGLRTVGDLASLLKPFVK